MKLLKFIILIITLSLFTICSKSQVGYNEIIKDSIESVFLHQDTTFNSVRQQASIQSLEQNYIMAAIELEYAGKSLKSYTSLKSTGYFAATSFGVGIGYGLYKKNTTMVTTCTIGAAFSILMIIGAENKIGEAGDRLIKSGIYLSELGIKIKF